MLKTATADSGQRIYLKVNRDGSPAGLWRYLSGQPVPITDRSTQPCPTFCGDTDGGRMHPQRSIKTQNTTQMEYSQEQLQADAKLVLLVALGAIIGIYIMQQF